MNTPEIFNKAVRYATSAGYFRDPTLPDEEQSAEEDGFYKLRAKSGAKLADIPVERLSGLSGEPIPVRGAVGSPTKARTQEEKAVEWALSMGYPVPSKMNGCLAGILVVVGLFAAIIPGVLLLVWLFVQQNQYQRDMRQLVAKWVDAGYPNPGEREREVTKLERIVETVENTGSTADTESRLTELQSMLDKGLISEEEYQAMRRKALGL